MLNNHKDVYVTKASGQREEFDGSKLRRSLYRSGATAQQIDDVVQNVQNIVVDGMSTMEIYRTAYKWLKRKSKPASARYNLKKAIIALGPTGFPFEKLTSVVLESMNYKTTTGKIIAGHCVKHEIDVIATKESHHIMVECKFHNRQGFVSDVKIPLYIQSRFLDVEKKWQDSGCHGPKFHQSWIVTNGRFSDDAIQYGTCMKMSLIGWDYPFDNGLKKLIDSSGLYPITCLTSLTDREKKKLLANDVIVCKSLLQNQQILSQIGLTADKINKVINECKMLCE